MKDDSGATILGTDLPREQCDEIMFGYFLKRMRLQPGSSPSFSNYKKFEDMSFIETELFRKKWFDYRFLHPIQATYYFAHCYEQAHRIAYSRHISRDRAEFIKVLKKPDLFENEPRFINGVFAARQYADAIGAPYDFFIEASIRHRLAYWKQKHLPQPSHLYADWVCEKVFNEWEDSKRHRVRHAENRLYRAPNYEGSRDQDEHRGFLVDTALSRADPKTLLASFVDQELLTLSWIAARLGQDYAERVAEAA